MRPEEIIADLCSDRIKDIIVDGDFGADGDDQFALGYALAAPDKVRVIAVTAAPYNENSDETVESGRQEAQDIVDVAGYSVKYGVFAGSPDYITRRGEAVNGDGVEAIAKAVRESDGPVYIVSTGCITNVTSALLLNPDIADKLCCVWLGLDGLDSISNTGEYNYHNDIEAGKLFFEHAKNLVLVEAGRTVAPYQRSDAQICEQYSESPLARHLAKRFCEIGWAQGLWDLCGESVFILPEACEFRVAPRPVFDEKGEILYLDESRTMVAVNKNDHERIAADSRIRINGHK